MFGLIGEMANWIFLECARGRTLIVDDDDDDGNGDVNRQRRDAVRDLMSLVPFVGYSVVNVYRW